MDLKKEQPKDPTKPITANKPAVLEPVKQPTVKPVKENVINYGEFKPKKPEATLDYSTWAKPTDSSTGVVKPTHQAQTFNSPAQAKPSQLQHLQNIHQAHTSNQAKAMPQKWQQPPLEGKLKERYISHSGALKNPNLNSEEMAQVSDPAHPMVPYMNANDHTEAYKFWYKQHQALEGRPDKDPAKIKAYNNYQFHWNAMRDKKQ